MEKYIGTILEYGIPIGLKIFYAVLILVAGRIIAGILTRFLRRLLVRRNVDVTLARFLVSLTRIALLVFIIVAAVNALGINTTSFVAIIGAAGLAVGLALQSSLANFASGVMMIIFRPFKAGDYIEGGGTSGIVDSIQIFNTILKTPDNRKVVVPNGKLTGDNIVNYSAMDQRRIDLIFGIGYGDDIRKAKATLERLLNEDARVLKDPPFTVAVLELGESSINFAVRPWVKTADYWDVYFSLTEKVKLAFDREGITIPFPQRDVHLHQVKAG